MVTSNLRIIWRLLEKKVFELLELITLNKINIYINEINATYFYKTISKDSTTYYMHMHEPTNTGI